jgi:hypothetical protein
MNYYRQCLIRISNNSLFLTWIYLHEIEKTERMKEWKKEKQEEYETMTEAR